MELMRQDLKDNQGYTLHIKKGYQAGSGLGSNDSAGRPALSVR